MHTAALVCAGRRLELKQPKTVDTCGLEHTHYNRPTDILSSSSSSTRECNLRDVIKTTETIVTNYNIRSAILSSKNNNCDSKLPHELLTDLMTIKYNTM